MLDLIRRKKEIKPYDGYGSNAAEVLRIDFGLTTELVDQITAKSLGDIIAACVDYRMAIEQCASALNNADFTVADKAKWVRQLNQRESFGQEMKNAICVQRDQVRQEATLLSPPAQVEVAVALSLMAAPEEQATEAAQIDITKQLLADAEDPKAQAKQARLAKKQQEKEVGAEAKTFLKTQEQRVSGLMTTLNVQSVKDQTKTLQETALPTLLAQAKPEVAETTTPIQLPPDAQKEILMNKLAKEMRKSTEQLDQDFPLS